MMCCLRRRRRPVAFEPSPLEIIVVMLAMISCYCGAGVHGSATGRRENKHAAHKHTGRQPLKQDLMKSHIASSGFRSLIRGGSSRDHNRRSSSLDDIVQRLMMSGDVASAEDLIRQDLESTAAIDESMTTSRNGSNGSRATSGAINSISANTVHHIVNPVNFRSPGAYLVTRSARFSDVFSIYFQLKTIQSDGLIMFAAGDSYWRSYSYSTSRIVGADFFAVELVNGLIRYVFNVTGNRSPRILRSKRRLSVADNRWHEITIKRPTLNRHVLSVDDIDSVDKSNEAEEFDLSSSSSSSSSFSDGGRAPPPDDATEDDHYDGSWGGSGSDDINPLIPLPPTVLYVGGVPVHMYHRLPKPIRSRRGFQGCLASVVLDGDNKGLLASAEIPIEHRLDISDVCQVPDTECTATSCDNGGECIQAWNSFSCDCELTSFTGPTCSEDGVVYAFGGDTDKDDGLIVFRFDDSESRNTEQDRLAFGLRTVQSEAALIRIVSDKSKDFIQIDLTAGSVSVVYNIDGHDHVIGSVLHRVNDDNYHVVRFVRTGANSTLHIDGRHIQSVRTQGNLDIIFDNQETIYIGSDAETLSTDDYVKPFRGLIAGLVFNGIHILQLAVEGYDARVEYRGHVRLDNTPLRPVSNIAETQLSSPGTSNASTRMTHAQHNRPFQPEIATSASISPSSDSKVTGSTTSRWSSHTVTQTEEAFVSTLPTTVAKVTSDQWDAFVVQPSPDPASDSVNGKKNSKHKRPHQLAVKATTSHLDFPGLTTSDDLIVSQANTRCPFDNSADVMDCVRHEPAYTDALLIPVSKLVSFARTFTPAAVTSPFDTDYDSSSGREPCLPVDDDCEMFSGDNDGGYDILNTRTSTMRPSVVRDDAKGTLTPQKPSKRTTTTTAAMATSTSGVSSSTPAAKKRRTTTITTTIAPSAATTSLSTLSSSPTTTTTTTTVTTTPIVVTVPKGFPDQPPYYGASGPYPVDGQGGHINPDGNPHYGVGGAVESRRNDLEQLKLNVGLIIGVAIGLSILLLIVAFVLYRYRGRPGELTSVHQALMKSDAQGGGLDAKKPYVYDTCNTMPPTPEMSVAPSRPLVGGTNTCSRSINVASATLPTQNHHQRNYQQQQSQQQQPNGAKSEVKEWYV